MFFYECTFTEASAIFNFRPTFQQERTVVLCQDSIMFWGITYRLQFRCRNSRFEYFHFYMVICFQIQPPTYTPPAPPKTDTVHSTPVRQRQNSSRHDTNAQCQSNLSSPEMSSCGFDSMVETAESDFIIALDVDDNEKMVIEFEGSSAESVQQQLKNLQLHR